MTAILNLAFLWRQEIINCPVHRHISRYPYSSMQRNNIILYKHPFTPIMRNRLRDFLMSSFSQSAASGLRKYCKTEYIQCTQYFMIPYIQNLVQNKNVFSIFHPWQESTEKECKISLIFSKKHKKNISISLIKSHGNPQIFECIQLEINNIPEILLLNTQIISNQL